MKKAWTVGALVALAAVVASVVAATGFARTDSPATTHAHHATLKIGLVTDIGGLNDRSFNHLAFVGLTKAHNQLGVDMRVLTSTQNSDYIPNLSALAQQGYDLVIGVGFLMHDAIRTVASKFPNTKFMIIDDAWASGDPTNLEGTVFHEEQAGYLVGYLAGLVVKNNIGLKKGKNVVSSVGGQKIPPVDHYIAGFQAGAKASDKGVKTLNAYSQDFVAQDKCKSLALNQIQAGSRVVFQVAGGCGLGALDAAKTKKIWGVGVDADQSYLGPYILSSAVKRVDTDVFTTVNQLQKGTFKPARTFQFSVKNGGIDIGAISKKVPAKYKAQIAVIKKKIAKNQIKIPNTVK